MLFFIKPTKVYENNILHQLAFVNHMYNGGSICKRQRDDCSKEFIYRDEKCGCRLVKSCFTENAVLQTIAKKGDEIKVENEPVSEFVDFVSKQTVGDADEQIVFDDIKIDGPLAMVWTPYQFYYKGKFSHCGVNSFQLVKVISGWKIQYIIDTRRKEGCK